MKFKCFIHNLLVSSVILTFLSFIPIGVLAYTELTSACILDIIQNINICDENN